MSRSPRTVALALAFLATGAPGASAQVSIDPAAGRWRVFTIEDAIDGSDLTQACTSDLTTDAQLCIQSRDGRISGAVLSVTNGQIVCPDFAPTCSIRHRFDAARPATLTAQPQNGRAVIARPTPFATRLATADQLVVELPIYRRGAVAVTFDVRGFPIPLAR